MFGNILFQRLTRISDIYKLVLVVLTSVNSILLWVRVCKVARVYFRYSLQYFFFLYIEVFFLFKISFCSLSFSLRLQNKRITLHNAFDEISPRGS